MDRDVVTPEVVLRALVPRNQFDYLRLCWDRLKLTMIRSASFPLALERTGDQRPGRLKWPAWTESPRTHNPFETENIGSPRR